jgi:hypothetical protein
VAVVASIALAGVLLWRPDRRVLLAVAVAAGAFALLDALEVRRQLDEGSSGLALLAALIALLHAAAAALALYQATRSRSRGPEPVTR